MMFMEPSHPATKMSEYLNSFSGPRLMKWPACPQDLNQIENLWSVLNGKCTGMDANFLPKMNYGRRFWMLQCYYC